MTVLFSADEVAHASAPTPQRALQSPGGLGREDRLGPGLPGLIGSISLTLETGTDLTLVCWRRPLAITR
jgi:hypothetical protein